MGHGHGRFCAFGGIPSELLELLADPWILKVRWFACMPVRCPRCCVRRDVCCFLCDACCLFSVLWALCAVCELFISVSLCARKHVCCCVQSCACACHVCGGYDFFYDLGVSMRVPLRTQKSAWWMAGRCMEEHRQAHALLRKRQVGVGVVKDVDAIRTRCHGFTDNGSFVDVAPLFRARFPHAQRLGLRPLAGLMLHRRLAKAQQMANWAQPRRLSFAMARYAACDAWVRSSTPRSVQRAASLRSLLRPRAAWLSHQLIRRT